MSNGLVIIDYADLLADPSSSSSSEKCEEGGRDSSPGADLTSRLAAAFGGRDSAGILAVRNVPNFVESRDAFLPLAHALAHLPPRYLESDLTDAASLYNAGWSHGKERLGDEPDFAKGSFYFNPLTDEPGSEDDRRRFPASYPRNVWPDEERMPGFEGAAKRLGRIMHGAVVLLARHIDAYAATELKLAGGGEYPPDLLYDAMRRTDKAKGRLLYYFPLSEDGAGDGDGGSEENPPQAAAAKEDSWIGWHNDSGFLTALAGDLYVDDNTGEALDPSSIDPDAGLYVVDRTGGTVRVEIPRDCMAVQIGECTQIVTGGAVVATPHCVRGAKSRPFSSSSGGRRRRVARISHPCFIDAPPDFPLRAPRGPDHRCDVLNAGVGCDRVPPLGTRWTEDGMAFGDFLQRTFATYYDWSKKGGDREDEK